MPFAISDKATSPERSGSMLFAYIHIELQRNTSEA
jgi:hypothetical protein